MKLRILGIMLFCVILGMSLSHRNQREKTDGFSVSSIQFDFPFHPEWESEALSELDRSQINDIFNQKFNYLSKGARSYAFLSEDCKYVLKFFKYRYAIPHWTVRYLPEVQPFQYFREKKLKKVSLYTVLNGYKIAYDTDPEGTGLVYIHLNPLESGLLQIQVNDKQGMTHLIDLDHTRFVVQKAVKELGPILDEFLEAGDIIQAKKVLFETIDLYFSHFQQGVYDTGIGLIKNNGILNGKPVHFDVGKMTFDARIYEERFQREVIYRLVENANRWFSKHYPQHQGEMKIALKDKIVQMYGSGIEEDLIDAQ